MREIRPSGSEGGGTELNQFSLPLSKKAQRFTVKHTLILVATILVAPTAGRS